MDALSTSVSSLRPGALLSTPHPRDLPNLLKPHPSSHLLPNLSAKPKPPHHPVGPPKSLPHHHPLASPKPLPHHPVGPPKPLPHHHPLAPPKPLPHHPVGPPKPLPHHHPVAPPKPLPHLSPSSLPRPRPPSKPSPPVHRRAATGYAAALVDAARCDGALDAVERDARRLLRAVAGAEEKGGALTAVAAEGGGFYKHVVALVRMLVRKGKAGMVGEVMAEVGRICDELSGTRVVVVSSSQRRMEEAELRGIAREVARVSGAAKVKVSHVFAV